MNAMISEYVLATVTIFFILFFSSRRRHTRWPRDWSSDVCSSDLRLSKLQQDCSLIDAEETLRGAFWQDVRPTIREWRKSRGLPEDPLQAFRSSGYLERITRERSEKNRNTTASYA